MRSYGIVILLPGGENGAGLGERREERFIEALVAQPPYEALDESVLLRLAGRDVVPGHIARLHPLEHDHAGELGPVVRHAALGSATLIDERIKLACHAGSGAARSMKY